MRYLILIFVFALSGCASFDSVSYRLSDENYGYWGQQWFKRDNVIYKNYFENVRDSQHEGKVLREEGYPDLIDINQFSYKADKRIWLYLFNEKMYAFSKNGSIETTKRIPFEDVSYLSGMIEIPYSHEKIAACDDCIDVIGLMPDVSTIEDFKSAGKFKLKQGNAYISHIEIGGYKLPCGGLFSHNRLKMLTCTTGKNHTNGTNLEIHDVFLRGFTEKFGVPVSIKNTPVRTRLGVEYISNEVTWKDKKGNKLTIKNLDKSIDEGSLTVISAEMWDSILEQANEKVKERRF